jgi:hypothetical protein
MVTFESSAGSIRVNAESDSDGTVEVKWFGAVERQPVTIDAVATFAGQRVPRQVRIERTGEGSPFRVDKLWGDRQAWYEERQLVDPVAVELRQPIVTTDGDTIMRAVPREKCSGQRVVFRQIGSGTATLDTVSVTYGRPKVWWGNRVRSSMSVPPGETCVAQTRWNLGKSLGEQYLVASLVGGTGDPLVFSARSRALPRIVAGLAGTTFREYDRVSESKRTFTVVRRITDDVVVTEDSTAVVKKAATGGGGVQYAPVVGIDWPLVHRVTWLRVSTSADVRDPRDNWFVGFSGLQALWGLSQESVRYDVQVVLNMGRRDVLTNPTACDGNGDLCKVDSETGLWGAGVMFVLDGGSFLGDLLKALAQ